MTDMAEAFSVFANGGIRKDLVSILKVVDKNGKVLEMHSDPNLKKEVPSQLLLKGTRVVSPETAFLISHILLDNNARTMAFGPSSELVIPGHAVSVKTGTTDDLRDNWTIGFTPQYLIATWVGNNDNSPMNPALVSGITGAAPIWHKLMDHVLKGKQDLWPKQPDGIVGSRVCTNSGLLPPNDGDDPGCPIRFEYFIRGTVPNQREQLKQSVLIDKDTGDIVAPGKVGANVEPQDKLVLHDFMSQYCLDCQHADSAPK
jgi:membrane peptidoglycan carboxypeptidase